MTQFDRVGAGAPPDDTAAPVVFVHLSDLHFRARGSPLAGREAMLRNRLLDDLPGAVALTQAKRATAVLITGDIARSGQQSEYQEARSWLDRLCATLEIDPTQTLTCPGNHDVDWNQLSDQRKKSNADLRSCSPNMLDAAVDRMLERPDDLLAPIGPYQEFAAGFACDVDNCLAWDMPPLPLARGYSLAIRGASSVINSDQGDGAGTMAVQRNQLQVERTPGVVRMLLIHHSPYFWRRPTPDAAKCGNHLVLYGHTHEPDHRVVDGTCLELTAGAVHPEETESFAIPAYNVIELSVEERTDPMSTTAVLRIRVFPRVFSTTDDCFLDHHSGPSIDKEVAVPRATEMNLRQTAGREDQMSGGADRQPPLQTAAGAPDPTRLVRSRFQHLGAGQRLQLLDRMGIPRIVIRDLEPHKQIATVADLVVRADRVEEFMQVAREVGAANAARMGQSRP